MISPVISPFPYPKYCFLVFFLFTDKKQFRNDFGITLLLIYLTFILGLSLIVTTLITIIYIFKAKEKRISLVFL